MATLTSGPSLPNLDQLFPLHEDICCSFSHIWMDDWIYICTRLLQLVVKLNSLNRCLSYNTPRQNYPNLCTSLYVSTLYCSITASGSWQLIGRMRVRHRNSVFASPAEFIRCYVWKLWCAERYIFSVHTRNGFLNTEFNVVRGCSLNFGRLDYGPNVDIAGLASSKTLSNIEK